MKNSIEKSFTVGKSVTWGVLMKDVDSSNTPDESTMAKLRKMASENLTNIDSTERDRRKFAGQIGILASAGIYACMLFFHVGLIYRIIGLYFPVAFSIGFYKSGENGL
jgi:hypothetical protein